MKSKKLRVLAMVVAAMFVMAAFAGCGSNTTKENDPTTTVAETSASAITQTKATNSKIDTSKALELKVYMVGDQSKDNDVVVAEINKLMKKKINATLKLDYMSWGDWSTKYPLVFASGEDFDGIYTAFWSFYGSQAQKHAFYELTNSFLQQYAPTLLSDIPKSAWNQAKINGKIFMVPQNTLELNETVFGVREDLMKKYKIPEMTSINGLDKYFEAIKKNEPGIVPINAAGNQGIFIDALAQQAANIRFAGNNTAFNYLCADLNNLNSSKLINELDTKEFLQYIKKVREWKLKGYMGNNVLVNKTAMTDSFKNGKSSVDVHNLGMVDSANNDFKAKHPGWVAKVVNINPQMKTQPYLSTGNGFAINAISENPERMIMAIELLKEDKEINYLANRGIKEKQWLLAGDGENPNITKPGPNAADYGDSLSWATSTLKFQPMPDPATRCLGYVSTQATFKAKIVYHPLMAFNFDDTKVKNELAAIKSVRDQYGMPLMLGYVDAETGIAQYKAKLKAAGFDKVAKEMQTQADAYFESVK